MSAPDVVQAATVPVLVAVAVVAFRQRRSHEGIPSLLVFLSFSVLAVVSAGVTVFAGEAVQMRVPRRVFLALLPLFAYLMFRFAAAVTPSSRWFRGLAVGLTAAAVASTLAVAATAARDRPSWNVVLLLVQWSLLSVAAAAKLWRAGRGEPPIARHRIRTLSVALVGLTVALVLAGVPETATLELVVRLFALASAILFLLALAPPAALRAAWRRRQEHRVHAAVVELMASTSAEQVHAVLLPHVANLLGGRGAALLDAEGHIASSHGPIESAGGHVHLADLSSGRLVVHLSPFTPLFARDEFEVVRSLASLAEVALERLREHHVAEMLQRSLLPTEFPPLAGIGVEARYLPGGAGAVGGDWYDVITLPEGRIGVAIGDVMGHGIKAAILMGQMRNSLRAYAVDGDAPATVLARLDRLMRHLDRPELVTVLYAIIEPETLTLRFATAGHLTPIVAVPGASAVMVLGPAGPPLGTWDAEPPETKVSLPAAATIALFTDGLVERRDESISRGLERLRASLDRHVFASAADRVIEDLLPNGERNDDAALLLIDLPPQRERGQARPCFEATTEFPAAMTSSAEARGFVSGALQLWGAEADADALLLLTSELVTNAVVHARTSLSLSLRSSDGCIRLTVTDENSRSVHPRRADATDEGGRGLMLVEALSSAWGVESHDSGKEVWCELRRAATTPPS